MLVKRLFKGLFSSPSMHAYDSNRSNRNASHHLVSIDNIEPLWLSILQAGPPAMNAQKGLFLNSNLPTVTKMLLLHSEQAFILPFSLRNLKSGDLPILIRVAPTVSRYTEGLFQYNWCLWIFQLNFDVCQCRVFLSKAANPGSVLLVKVDPCFLFGIRRWKSGTVLGARPSIGQIVVTVGRLRPSCGIANNMQQCSVRIITSKGL